MFQSCFQYTFYSSNGMKYFLILVFSLLAAESSFAGNCETDYEVDINVISDPYREAVNALPLPHIEYGDNATEFRNAFVNDILTYNDQLITLIYDRAKQIGEELNNALRKLNCDLQKCIKSIETGIEQPSCANRILKLIIKQFTEFFSLIPGNVLIKRRALPELPEQTVNITSKTSKLTPAEVFVNLAENVDGDFNILYAYITTMHIEGWSAARVGFNLLQEQIRNKVLNDQVLKFYNEVAAEIIACGTESHVDPKIWKSFKEDSADRVRFISDDYNTSKERECSS